MGEILPIKYIERRSGSNYFWIAGKEVSVEFLSLFLHNKNWTMERLCRAYDLTPAEVHAAWSFYYDHRAEVDRHIQEEEEATRKVHVDPDQRAEWLKWLEQQDRLDDSGDNETREFY
jgi:uncharacterized protein (DUF433 family)